MRRFQRLPIQLLLTTICSLGLLFLGTGIASARSMHATHPATPAHARVNQAVPAIGSTVNQAPSQVTVFTLENIKPGPQVSNLFVYAPSGDLISQGNPQYPLSNPKEMSINIKPSGDGVYIVRWITVSADDGDPDEGAFFFTVKSGAATAPTPTPAASTTGQNTTPTNTSGSQAAAGTPLWVPIVVGLLALLVGIGGGFGLGMNRRKTAATSSIGAMRQAIAQQQAEEKETTPKP